MAQNIRGAANGERYAVVVSVVVVVRLPVYFAFGGPLDFGGAKSTQPSAKCSATVSAKKKNKKKQIQEWKSSLNILQFAYPLIKMGSVSLLKTYLYT